MNSRFLLGSAAVIQLASGLALLFAPREVLASFGGTIDDPIIPIIQVLSGAVSGLGIMTWLLRRAPFGGIYGRPLLLANLTFSLVGSLTLLKVAFRTPGAIPLWGCAIVLGLLALGFGLAMYRSPEELRS